MRSVGVAVAGAGYMGAEEARVLASLPGVRVPVIYNYQEPSARELAQEVGAEWTTDLEAAIRRPDVDGVVVATANDVHLEPVLTAIRFGKPIFLEKPMALSTADCNRMIGAADAAGVFILVGLPFRFMAGVRAMKELVPAVTGRPLVARAVRTVWSDLEDPTVWKVQRQRSGGDLFHHLHELDLLCWLLGEPSRVYARLANLAHGHLPEYYDATFLTVEFAEGALAHVESGTAWRWPEHRVMVAGEQGAVQLDVRQASVTVIHRDGRREEIPLFDDPACNASLTEYYQGGAQNTNKVYGTVAVRPPLYLRRAILDEMRHFAACLRGEESPFVPGREGARSVALAEAAERSADEDRAVPVNTSVINA